MKDLLKRDSKIFRVKIKLRDERDVTLGMSKETFFKFRDLFSESLKKLTQVERVEYEVSEEFKKKYNILEENSELIKLYEELVVGGQFISQDEFFNNEKSFNLEDLQKRFTNQDNPTNSDFFVTKRRQNEYGEEVIFMRQEDKIKLLDQFPELRNQFENLFLHKFNDQPETEAKFWDDFWRIQKEKKTLLFGDEAKDSKDIMKNLPVFDENKDQPQPKLEDAVDALNLREKEEDLYEKYLFMGKGAEKSGNIVDLLNNHSIMIKSKEEDLGVRMQGVKEDAKVDFDYIKSKPGKMNIEEPEKTPNKITSSRAETEESYKAKFTPEKRAEMEKCWKDFNKELKKKRENPNPIVDPMMFIDTDNPENNEMRDRLYTQMQKYENKEVTGTEYDSTFRGLYIPITKKLYFLNSLIYSMNPVKSNDEVQKNKVKALWKYLKNIRTEIEVSFKPIIDKLREQARGGGPSRPEVVCRLKIYEQAVNGLLEISEFSKRKLSG